MLVDGTMVDLVDSSMLGALLGACRRHTVAIAATPGSNLWRLFAISALLGVLPIHPTVLEASRALRAA